jgi:hypothetical protein
MSSLYALVGIATTCAGGIAVAIRKARNPDRVSLVAKRALVRVRSDEGMIRAEARGGGAVGLYRDELVYVPRSGEPARVPLEAITDTVAHEAAFKVEWKTPEGTRSELIAVEDGDGWVAALAAAR